LDRRLDAAVMRNIPIPAGNETPVCGLFEGSKTFWFYKI
jgi:hypothetical protein